MTLPEFLAVAVKARRWVLVGDPDQLPPFNNIEENGTTLDDVIDSALELACSVGSLLERTKPGLRPDHRSVVVARDPARVCEAVRAHLVAVGFDNAPPVSVFGDADEGIVICSASQVDEAIQFVAPVRQRDRTHNPRQPGSVSVLIERGVAVARPEFASGTRFADPRLRAQPSIFDNAFGVYHAQPWAKRSQQKLRVVAFRNGHAKYLPSTAAVDVLNGSSGGVSVIPPREALVFAIAERLAVNTVSVYDWLTGMPIEHFDTSPLSELSAVSMPFAALQAAVRPYVGVLKKQYRMDPSLSRVPRALFYFEEALFDGRSGSTTGSRVKLMQVDGVDGDRESNRSESKAILDLLATLSGSETAKKHRPKILVITPYKEQERHLEDVVDSARLRGGLDNVDVEVCTLDRCQGREAEYVFISLVRNKASVFMDAPKRWNVALTRAMEGLFIFGDINAFLREARRERETTRIRGGDGRPMMSLLARILEAYDQQEHASVAPPRVHR